MKAFLAYSLLIIGLPQLVGLLVGAAVTTPIAWIIPYPARFRAMQYLAILHGVASAIAAFLLFWLFGVPVGVAVLIILIAWITWYFISYGQPLTELVSFVTGIIAGWFVARSIF
jgi:ABC-type Mn2+/Zn2+ transport system permease subunit